MPKEEFFTWNHVASLMKMETGAWGGVGCVAV